MVLFLELISCSCLFLVFLDLDRIHWEKIVIHWLIMIICLFLVFQLATSLGFKILDFLPFFSVLPFLILVFTKKRF